MLTIRSNGDVEIWFARDDTAGHGGTPWSTQNISHSTIDMGGVFYVGYIEAKPSTQSFDFDEVAVWNRALSPTEIQDLFDLGKAGTALPEPSSLLLGIGGTLGMLGLRSRRRRI